MPNWTGCCEYCRCNWQEALKCPYSGPAGERLRAEREEIENGKDE